MPTPHPVLDAAIDHLARQPGVTSDDVAQFKAALVSDAALTKKMEEATASGALRGFARATPGTADQPVGHYDQASGIVTLPLSSFNISGATPAADMHAVLRVQSMVVDFGQKSFADSAGNSHPATPDMLNNLQDTMNGSPVLAAELKRAATTPDPLQPPHRILESFDFTAPGAGVGGSFSAPTHTMNLVSESLATTTSGSTLHYNKHELTFIIGHEVQHGFNARKPPRKGMLYFSTTSGLWQARPVPFTITRRWSNNTSKQIVRMRPRRRSLDGTHCAVVFNLTTAQSR